MFNAYFRACALLGALLAVSFLYFDLVLQYSFQYWWWDSYEHFLGGVVVGYFALWLGYLRYNRRISLGHTVAFLLVIGITWELWEVAYDIGASPFMSRVADTAKDVILDALGAMLAWYSTRWIKI